MAELELVSQLKKLKNEHADLEAAISRELRRPHPDESALAKLKRQKLKIKDELLRLHAA